GAVTERVARIYLGRRVVVVSAVGVGDEPVVGARATARVNRPVAVLQIGERKLCSLVGAGRPIGEVKSGEDDRIRLVLGGHRQVDNWRGAESRNRRDQRSGGGRGQDKRKPPCHAR